MEKVKNRKAAKDAARSLVINSMDAATKAIMKGFPKECRDLTLAQLSELQEQNERNAAAIASMHHLLKLCKDELFGIVSNPSLDVALFLKKFEEKVNPNNPKLRLFLSQINEDCSLYEVIVS
jgi:hypothetical protein